jgi:two-component system chemotaxis response regulator CheY
MPESSSTGVAIVDDEAQLAKSYELLFKLRHIPVSFIAYDGCAALEMFKNANTKPGVVIIDHRMPLMSGLELTREILVLSPCTKIIFVSADEDVKEEAIDAGATVFMKKPTPIKEITETVNSMLK